MRGIHPSGGYKVNVCYCDESGTGSEPVATMAGIVVDASRMHRTKDDWQALLAELTAMAGREVQEIHTRSFYPGNGFWRQLDGETRRAIITAIFGWLEERRHHVVYAAVVKESYHAAYNAKDIPDELNTVWRFMGFHLVLAMQKYGQRESGIKGHTLFVFDNEEREKMRFADVIRRPPGWSDTYYDRGKKQKQLDQVIDVPYFADSVDVVLIQLADLTSYLLRRYAEIESGLVGPKYEGEKDYVDEWISKINNRCIPTSFMYPRRGRDRAAELFYRHAPTCIREMP